MVRMLRPSRAKVKASLMIWLDHHRSQARDLERDIRKEGDHPTTRSASEESAVNRHCHLPDTSQFCKTRLGRLVAWLYLQAFKRRRPTAPICVDYASLGGLGEYRPGPHGGHDARHTLPPSLIQGGQSVLVR